MLRRIVPFISRPSPLRPLSSLGRSHSTFAVNETSLSLASIGAHFPYQWLRDSCPCPECIDPSTRQKLRSTADVRPDIKPKEDGVKMADDGINITWNTDHQSFYTNAFLQNHSSRRNLTKFHKEAGRQTWNTKEISKARDLFLPYSKLKTQQGLLDAIDQLSKYGLLFVSGVPNQETSDSTCELPTLARYFGEIRETFYGVLFDVKNVKNSINIAYTNLYLGLHMDLLYCQSPPRYQILHCLRNRVSGGSSIFVDAIRVAEDLRTISPIDYNILATTPVAFHYINNGHHLYYEHPTIQLPLTPPHVSESSPERHANTKFITDPSPDFINYSPPFQGPLPLTTPPNFYPAFTKFERMLGDDQYQYKYLLKEGDAVLFDNRRVLHARTAFRDLDKEKVSKDALSSSDLKAENSVREGETNRWLKGCYLEADALLDRGRVLKGKIQAALSN